MALSNPPVPEEGKAGAENGGGGESFLGCNRQGVI